ncbi:MAG: SDR family NAD(P)-dependent oxidoreductase [Candidatus Nanohalobium sp.]
MRIAITGAAGGIGSQASRMLEEKGHEVLAVDRDKKGLEDLDVTSTYCFDVGDEEAVENFVEENEYEVLVNLAGYQEAGSLEDMSSETVEKMFEDNVFGTLNMIRHSMPMLREKSGRIVNTSSIAGRATVPFYGVYSATKFSIEALSDALRGEVKQFDVDVVIVEPGYINTGFNVRGLEAVKKYMLDSVYSDRYNESLEHGGLPGTNSEKAGKKVVKAVTASRPKRRYTITWLAWLAPKLKRFLPRKFFYMFTDRA